MRREPLINPPAKRIVDSVSKGHADAVRGNHFLDGLRDLDTRCRIRAKRVDGIAWSIGERNWCAKTCSTLRVSPTGLEVGPRSQLVVRQGPVSRDLATSGRLRLRLQTNDRAGSAAPLRIRVQLKPR